MTVKQHVSEDDMQYAGSGNAHYLSILEVKTRIVRTCKFKPFMSYDNYHSQAILVQL